VYNQLDNFPKKRDSQVSVRRIHLNRLKFYFRLCPPLLAAGLFSLLVFSGRVTFCEDFSDARPYSFYDFGYLPQKTKVSHTFYVYNTGPDSLRVSRIASGCSCTSASEINRPIPPGDSAAVTVTFKSGRYHHKVQKTTKVYTDDAVAPVRHLRIAAFVYKKGEEIGPVSITPPILTCKIEKGVICPALDTLCITNPGDRDMKIEIEHYPRELIEKATVLYSISPGDTAHVVLEVLPKTFDAEPEGLSLTLVLTGKDTTRVTVPLELENR
jgi:hypothetical protein